MKKGVFKKLEGPRMLIVSVAIGLMLGGGMATIHAWTEPSEAPPNGNVGAPINMSEVTQTKEGGLVINSESIDTIGLTVNNGVDVHNGDITFVSSLADGDDADDGNGVEHYGYNDNPYNVCMDCGPSYNLYFARGTESAPKAPGHEELGAISFSAYNTQGADFYRSAQISAEASASQSSVIGDVPADIVFYTTTNIDSGTGNPMTEKMRIGHNGFVGIGLDEDRESGGAYTSITAPDQRLHIKAYNDRAIRIEEDESGTEYFDIGINNSGDLQFIRDDGVIAMTLRDENGFVGLGSNTGPSYRLDLPNVASTDGWGRANAWLTYSSKRWKENIVPIDNALEKISRLSGVYYDWKEDHGGAHDIGFIAENVAEVLPEVVNFAENGVDADSLDYARITALNLEGVRELLEEDDKQQQEIESLRAIVCADHPEAEVCQ